VYSFRIDAANSTQRYTARKNVNIIIIMRTDYMPKDTKIPEKEQYGKDVPRI